MTWHWTISVLDVHSRRRPHAPPGACPATVDVDVAIVGAGYTGLWTAYYLAAADPSLRIAVLEARDRRVRRLRAQRRLVLGAVPHLAVGAGPPARPRRGGGPLPGDARHRGRGGPGGGGRGHRLPLGEGRHGRPGPHADAARPGPRAGSRRPARSASAPRTSTCSTPDEARRAVRGDRRARRHVHAALRGDPPGPAGARPGPRGGAARRARSTSARRPSRCAPRPGRHRPRARSRAPIVVRATEGYTPELPGAPARARAGVLADGGHRAAARSRSGPRPGWRRRETFADLRHLIIYGQRTADDRLAFGGRGAPYHFGSPVRPGVRPRAAGLRGAPRARSRSCSRRSAGVGDHAHLGRAAGRRPGLVGLGRAGPRHRPGLGRRVRRRRRGNGQPGRPYAGRPDPGRGQRADRAALGRAPLAAAGSPSRCAGSASTRPGGWWPAPTASRPGAAARHAAPRPRSSRLLGH